MNKNSEGALPTGEPLGTLKKNPIDDTSEGAEPAKRAASDLLSASEENGNERAPSAKRAASDLLSLDHFHGTNEVPEICMTAQVTGTRKNKKRKVKTNEEVTEDMKLVHVAILVLPARVIASASCPIDGGASSRVLLSLRDNTVRVYGSAVMAEVSTIRNPHSGSPATHVCPIDPTYVVTGGCDGRLVASNQISGRQVADTVASATPIRSMDAWSGYIISVGSDKMLKFHRLVITSFSKSLQELHTPVQLRRVPKWVKLVLWFGELHVLVAHSKPLVLKLFSMREMAFIDAKIVLLENLKNRSEFRIENVVFDESRLHCAVVISHNSLLRVVAGDFEDLQVKGQVFEVTAFDRKRATSNPTFSWNLQGTALWLSGCDNHVKRLTETSEGSVEVKKINKERICRVIVCSGTDGEESVLMQEASKRGKMNLLKYRP